MLLLPIFVFGTCTWDIGLSFGPYHGIDNRLSILQIFACGVCLADISVSKISLSYLILGILGIVYLPIHSFHIYTPQVMVCTVFCCRAGETLSHESRIDSLGFRSNMITTSSKNGKVNALLSQNLFDATMKIWVNECHKWNPRLYFMCQSVTVCGILSL